jgi:hypothetical protein
VGQQLADDPHALLGRLPRSVDRLRHALAQRPVVVDERVTEVGERQPAQSRDGVIGRHDPAAQIVDEATQRRFVHPAMLPEDAPTSVSDTKSGPDLDPSATRNRGAALTVHVLFCIRVQIWT